MECPKEWFELFFAMPTQPSIADRIFFFLEYRFEIPQGTFMENLTQL